MNTETLHIELLHEKTARKDAEDLLSKQEDTINSLNQQLEAIKNDFQKNIKEQTGKIQSIAMFSLQSPDPQIRISFDGTILFQNTAAKKLTTFFYQDNYYEGEDFWKYLSQLISSGKTTWRIEAKSRLNTYSFNCKVLNVEGYINIYGTDITEKKEAERKLKAYELHFRAALDAIGDNIWEHDFRTNKTFFSKSLDNLLGYTSKESTDNIGLWWMSTHAEDKKMLEDNDTKYKNGLIDHHSIEYRVIQKDGSIKWVLDRGKVIESTADGKPLKIIGTHTDITERKITEEVIRESEMRFKDLAQRVPGVVYQWQENNDGSSGFTYVSPRLKEYFDIEPEEAHIITEFIHPEDKERWRNTIANAHQKEISWEFEGRLLYPDGSIRWWRGSSIMSIKKETGRLYNGIILNITAQKENEQRILKAEQLYKFALEGAGDGAWEHDFIENKVFYSSRYKKMLGYKEDEFNNDVGEWRAHLHPEDKEKAWRIIEDYKTGLIEKHSSEYRIRCKDESYIWVLDRGMLIEKTPDGKPKKIIGTHAEITKQKQLQVDYATTANRLSNLICNLQDGVMVEDEKGQIVLVNNRFCELFGIDTEPGSLIGKKPVEGFRESILLFKDPVLFKNAVEEFLLLKQPATGKIFELTDGRIFALDAVPIFTEPNYNGYLWKFTDITEKMDADKKLDTQRKFYEDILNEIPADIAVFSREYKYLFVNPTAIKDPATREWIIGKTDEEFCRFRNKPMSIAEERKKILTKTFTTKKQHDFEEKMFKADGSPHYFLRRMYPVLDAEGNVKILIGYGLDITERKKIEEQVQLNAKRFRDLFNFSQAMICTHDLNGKLLTVNPFICKTLEYGESEMVGNNLIGFLPEKNKHLFQGHYLDAITNNSNTEGEFTVLSKSGKKIHLLYRNYKVEEPGLEPYVIGFSQDITERKNTEEIIRKSEEKYRGIIENMNLGLMEVDNEEKIIYANQSFCDMSGYTQEDLILNIASNFFLRRNHLNIIKENNEQKKGITDAHEAAVKNKRGELKWWLISGAPLLNPQGQVKGSIGIHLDITQQKVLERELRKAKQEAERASSAKEIFLANMSHEIRTPMNAILNMGHQLQKTGVNEKQNFYISTINTAASNLLIIINDILDFSKIEAGKLTLERIGFRLSDVINHSFCVIKQKAEEKGLLLSYTLDHNISPVFTGDPHRLNQVLINLLNNAIKFTETGHVKVVCTLKDGSQINQVIQIEVNDTGIGMSETFLQNLFAKFSQEDESAARKYGGTGLGMSISKQLIELMGGRIEVKSQKNYGTQIFITLPFEKGRERDLPVKNKEILNADTIKNKKILLVEDNEMNRLVAITILNSYGIIVEQAENGQVAIELLSKNTYDIILMDIRMPVMDGIQATHIIRKEINKEIPIIALTANALKTEQQKCLNAGMNDFLAKPFEENDLINLISKWLNIQNKTQSSSPVSLSQDQKLFSLAKLDLISRGNQAFVQKMINIFIKENKTALNDISQAFQNSDIQTINSIAHKIKPSIANMGIETLKETILKLEKFQAAENSNDELKTLICTLENVLNTVFNQINQLTQDLII